MPILLITSKVTFVRTIPGASTVFCQSKFWTSFKNLELEKYEKELLDEGDSLIPAEASDDVKGGMMMWED